MSSSTSPSGAAYVQSSRLRTRALSRTCYAPPPTTPAVPRRPGRRGQEGAQAWRHQAGRPDKGPDRHFCFGSTAAVSSIPATGHLQSDLRAGPVPWRCSDGPLLRRPRRPHAAAGRRGDANGRCAGARRRGTGKTKTLTRAVAHRIEVRGILASRVLAVTSCRRGRHAVRAAACGCPSQAAAEPAVAAPNRRTPAPPAFRAIHRRDDGEGAARDDRIEAIEATRERRPAAARRRPQGVGRAGRCAGPAAIPPQARRPCTPRHEAAGGLSSRE